MVLHIRYMTEHLRKPGPYDKGSENRMSSLCCAAGEWDFGESGFYILKREKRL